MKRGEAKEPPVQPVPPPPSGVTTLLAPVAADDELVAGFKRYLELRDKLLEEQDYTWFVVYQIGDKPNRKGFTKREEAEALVKALQEKKVAVELEKKIKKSGCLKLGKAFAISTGVIAVERTNDRVTYTIRAEAPNGQYSDRTGSCDRQNERGKQNSPFDHIDAIALTRATNRAIMGLLGGENTAEEMDGEVPLVVPDADAAHPAKVYEMRRPEAKTEAELKGDLSAKFGVEGAVAHPLMDNEAMKRMFDLAKEAGYEDLDNFTKEVTEHFKVESWADMTQEMMLATVKALETRAARRKEKNIPGGFGKTEPAKPRGIEALRGEMFAAAKAAGYDSDGFKKEVYGHFKIASVTEMTEAMMMETTKALKTKAAKRQKGTGA